MRPFRLSAYSVASTDPINSLNLVTGSYSITRDPSGEIASIVDQNKATALFSATYDPAWRMTGISSNYFGVPQSVISTQIGYDGFGRKKTVTHSTGLAGSYAWDALNRPTSITWSGNDGTGANLALSEKLTYDPLRNVITQVDREFGTFKYGYDLIDELTSMSYSGSLGLPDPIVNRTLAYDLAGNRADQSQIANVLTGDTKFIYYPDEDGYGELFNRIDPQTGVAEIFSYRADELMSQYYNGGSGLQVDYSYDALGRRVAKKITPAAGTAFTQTYGYLGDVSQLLVAQGGDGTRSIYLDGQGDNDHLAEISATSVKAFSAGNLGNILNAAAAGAAGSFGAFGESLAAPAAITAQSEPVAFGFAGLALDPENGQYATDQRSYMPNTGRFTVKDPIGYRANDYNLYRYVANSPLDYIDPDGTIQKPFQGTGSPGGGYAGSAGGVAAGVASALIPIVLPLNPVTTSSSLPLKGQPNSCGVKTGPNGEKVQERYYDQNGNPVKDIDYSHDHGQGIPHVHDWAPDPVTGKPVRQPGRSPNPGEVSE